MRSVTLASFVSVFAMAASLALHAQSPAPVGEPSFEVVSIKPNVTAAAVGFSSAARPDGSITMTNGTLAMLISMGYAGQEEIVGLPDWAATARFDVNATVTPGSKPTADQRRAMARAMLADRFKLAAHHETREVPAFDLVLARNAGKLGPSLTRSDIDCVAYGAAQRAAAEAARAAGAPPPPRPEFSMTDPLPPCSQRSSGSATFRRFEGHMTLAGVAAMLRSSAGRLVVDKTGLTGYYHVRLESTSAGAFATAEAAATAGDLPSVFTAVQEQLGLKLESSRASVQVLVIDHVERPTEN